MNRQLGLKEIYGKQSPHSEHNLRILPFLFSKQVNNPIKLISKRLDARRDVDFYRRHILDEGNFSWRKRKRSVQHRGVIVNGRGIESAIVSAALWRFAKIG